MTQQENAVHRTFFIDANQREWINTEEKGGVVYFYNDEEPTILSRGGPRKLWYPSHGPYVDLWEFSN